MFDPYAPLTGRTLQTQLFQSPFTEPPGCGPGRSESQFKLMMNGKLYTFTVRDKIVPEDHYVTMLKAYLFSLQRTEEYRGIPPSRQVRDFLIKQNLSI